MRHRSLAGATFTSVFKRQKKAVPSCLPTIVSRKSSCMEIDRKRSSVTGRTNRRTWSCTGFETQLASVVSPGGLIGLSQPMRMIHDLIRKATDRPFPVLISGETGTGKELVARSIHNLGLRRSAPFVAVDCSSLSQTLIETELFGHLRGAFTGADAHKKGLVEAADTGTLFLDEIGELPPELQAKLLRVIQEHEVRPVGSAYAKPIDVRFIAATHRDLRIGVDNGRFRSDLYYRLNVIPIEMPPSARAKSRHPAPRDGIPRKTRRPSAPHRQHFRRFLAPGEFLQLAGKRA